MAVMVAGLADGGGGVSGGRVDGGGLGEAGSRAAVRATRVGVVKEAAATAAMTAAAGQMAKAKVDVGAGARATRGWAW